MADAAEAGVLVALAWALGHKASFVPPDSVYGNIPSSLAAWPTASPPTCSLGTVGVSKKRGALTFQKEGSTHVPGATLTLDSPLGFQSSLWLPLLK